MRLRTYVAVAAMALSIACGSSSGTTSASSQAATASSQGKSYTVSNNTPRAVKGATDNGPVDPATVITVTAWLKLHNENQLDQLVAKQTTRGNASYRKWLTQAQLDAQFSPTGQEVNSVGNFLSAHNLSVVEVAENNWYVKVKGTVADVQKAFHVQIDSFTAGSLTFRSNKGDPSVTSGPGNIDALTGLDDIGFHPNVAWRSGPDGAEARFVPLNGPNGTFTTGTCFTGTESHTFTSAAHTASYGGNRYQLCGYNPAEVQAAYNLGPAYAAGLTGQGETIVITDAYGSATIQNDAAAFSSFMNLPPVDLTVVGGQGLTNDPHAGSWPDEVTLDVEWAHAMAPAAKIVLVVATDRSSLDEAINRAVVHHYGNTISNSWSTLEGYGNPAQERRVNRILQMAAAQGIDVNFSSGDDGDNRYNGAGFVTVDFPASSPWATSIGGTSLVLSDAGAVEFQTGWGTNITNIAGTDAAGNPPVVPPDNSRANGRGFVFGAGGGTSLTYPKPAWQSSLAGTMRKVPDISAVADPYTGVEIIETVNGQLSVGVIGGTSLSAPVFSGIMALAAQKAGHALGQAAPLVYGLSSGVTDVLAVQSGLNVSGTIDGAPVTDAQLSAPLFDTTTFTNAFYQGGSTRWYVLSFGTDTSLTTEPGWDDVTGVGVPDGLNFLDAVAQ